MELSVDLHLVHENENKENTVQEGLERTDLDIEDYPVY